MNTRITVLFAAVCMLPVSSIAQDSIGGRVATMAGIDRFSIQQKHWLVTGKVKTLQGDPVAGAKVEVAPTSASGEFRILVTNFQGEFRTEYSLNSESVKEFGIDLKVTKKGFRKAHSVIDFGASDKTWVIPITLREPEEDSALLSQAALISGLGPRLNKLGASDGLSAAGEKDYARGVEEFLDRKRSDRALPFFTKVVRRDASCMLCRTELALAELDSGDWDGAYHNLVEVFNKMQADQSLGRSEPALALGVMESWRRQPTNAAGYFVAALKFAPQDPLALQELGRSQLLIQNWAAADQYLSKALDAGAGPEVRLLHIEALLGEDQFQTANTEMTRYLDGRDVKKMPILVRQLWVQIQEGMKVESAYLKGQSKGDAAIDYLHRPPSDLNGLEPASDQGQLDSILSAVGKTVAEFLRNFPNTSSLEQIHEEKLHRKQKGSATLDQKFRYLCLSAARDGGPGFEEYRADLFGIDALPQGLQDGFMRTSGFTSASLVFHPAYQPQAAFRYLGRQKVNGRDTYVIAFAQQPGKARLNGTFKSGQTTMKTFSQGLAWIDSQSYEITRLRTDLLKPLPEVYLERETTEIAFGEVLFKGMAEGFWLPQQVTVAVDWNGKHLRNEHHYSEYKLFNVEATERIGKLGEVGQTSEPVPDSKVAH